MTLPFNSLSPHRLKPMKRPVTLIVGIICKDAIVMAADSQTTCGTAKRPSDKMSKVRIGDSDVLIAQSGDLTLSSNAVELIERLCAGAAFDDYRKPAEIAQEAVRRLKSDLARINNWEGRQDTPQLVAQHFQDNPTAIMLAYCYQDKPYIYTIDFGVGFPTRYYDYATIGCGGTVAEFMLTWFKTSEMNSVQAGITAVYIVEEVKKVDAYCSGDTKAGRVVGKTVSLINMEIQGWIILDSIREFDAKAKSEWEGKMNHILMEVGRKGEIIEAMTQEA